MTDIDTSVKAIQVLIHDCRQTVPYVLESISSLESALSCLSGLDDEHARNAESDVRSAISELRSAHATWLDHYTRRSDDLCRRLVA